MSQRSARLLVVILIILGLLAACDSEETPIATPPSATATAAAVPNPSPTTISDQVPTVQTEGVLFSELLTGIPGGNSHEFIELYNAASEPVDLLGWSIFYLLGEGQEQELVYRWTETAVIPPHGHVLLVREGQAVGAAADGFFSQSLFERKGGLLLRDKTQQTVDLLGWGDAPAEFTAGGPIIFPEGGASLERLPGGVAGNGQNSGSNAADFVVLTTPNPQNSGSSITPQPDEFLTIAVSAPEAIEPGTQFALTVEVGNESETAVTNVTVSLPIASHFELISSPEGAELANGRLTWIVPEVAANGSETAELTLQSPFTYIDTLLTGYFADAEGYLAAFGPPQLIIMAGGSIPIATARNLVGSTVTVEGVATMYTGGFFAGSTSTKFYIQDETGGVQIFVPDGMASVNVDLGDVVRVSGEIEIFRDSVEVIPADFAGDIEIIATDEPLPEPRAVSATELESAVGQYVVAEGNITRIEEFNFSYEVDLQDAAGGTVLLYIEKDTGVTAEPLILGNRYRAVGIGELASGQLQLKPRLQSDIAEIIPPIVLLEMQADNTALPGEVLTYTVTAANYTTEPLTNVIVELKAPGGEVNAVPEVIAAERPLPTIRAAVENELSIATFNVENLFDLLTPHPSSPPLPTVFEYRAKLDKIAQTIVAMGAPTIIGLQEVENIDVLQDLVEEESIAELGYEPFLVEGNDSRGIDVGYLVRSDRAMVESAAAFDAPGDLFARPPLVITVTVHLESGDQTIIVLNNHFLSLSAGEEATEPVRAAQAAWNATAVEQLAVNAPEAHFVVLGDLNSFYQTLPLDKLEQAGLRHVYQYLPEEERPYTYNFAGRTQTLDHILVSPALFDRLTLVEVLHSNADYPLGDPEDSSPRRVSDHDPLVAIFTFIE